MNKVIIEVSGGVAYLKSAPKGVDVEIIDFDNAEGESNEYFISMR
jgi:spermidine synthase